MSNNNPQQFCAICAWRENCAKKFCVSDNGAHCPDYTRDISIKTTVNDDNSPQEKQEK